MTPLEQAAAPLRRVEANLREEYKATSVDIAADPDLRAKLRFEGFSSYEVALARTEEVAADLDGATLSIEVEAHIHSGDRSPRPWSEVIVTFGEPKAEAQEE
jgi:hypothetical protein